MKPKYAALAAAALADKIIGGSPPGTYTINILAPYFVVFLATVTSVLHFREFYSPYFIPLNNFNTQLQYSCTECTVLLVKS